MRTIAATSASLATSISSLATVATLATLATLISLAALASTPSAATLAGCSTLVTSDVALTFTTASAAPCPVAALVTGVRAVTVLACVSKRVSAGCIASLRDFRLPPWAHSRCRIGAARAVWLHAGVVGATEGTQRESRPRGPAHVHGEWSPR